MNALVPFQPVEPAATEVADMLKGYLDDMQRVNGLNTLTRKVTPQHRAILKKRLDKVSGVMKPISYAIATQERAASIIGRFLGTSYPTYQPDNPHEIISAYVAAAQDVPLFALEAACDAIAKGEMTRVQVEGGYYEKISPTFPPTPVLLTIVAKSKIDIVGVEWAQLREVLAVERLRELPKPRDPEIDARVRESMRALVEELNAPTEREIAERKERMAKEAKKANVDFIQRDYANLGIAPKHTSNGLLITPSLLRSIGRESELRLSDDEFQKQRRGE